MRILQSLIPVIVFLTTALLTAQVEQSYDLTLEGAKKIMKVASDYAKANNAPGGAIAIVDSGGHVILLERLTGTFPAASDVSIGKARTAATFTFESKKLEDAIIGGRTSLITVGHNMLRGGLPIKYKGQVVGGIGVSGAASADQDVEIAQAGASAKFD
ncbi:MAG: heme-binding protein [Bacteroidota bacterium]